MELTEFLLARVAEDEAETRYVSEDGGWELASYMDSSDDFPPVLTISRARVLAECDAKRRIVEMFETSDPGEWGDGALRYLALPYADHPDYDPAWSLTDAHA